LIAISEQFVASDFVVDPKHFVNVSVRASASSVLTSKQYAHSILRKGDIGFDSFQHAAEVRNLISSHAASEIAEERDLAWSDIVLGRVKTCRKAAELSKKHLFDQLVWEWSTDEVLSKHAQAVADLVYDRAVA
jgi:hypothetical protein